MLYNSYMEGANPKLREKRTFEVTQQVINSIYFLLEVKMVESRKSKKIIYEAIAYLLYENTSHGILFKGYLLAKIDPEHKCYRLSDDTEYNTIFWSLLKRNNLEAKDELIESIPIKKIQGIGGAVIFEKYRSLKLYGLLLLAYFRNKKIYPLLIPRVKYKSRILKQLGLAFNTENLEGDSILILGLKKLILNKLNGLD